MRVEFLMLVGVVAGTSRCPLSTSTIFDPVHPPSICRAPTVMTRSRLLTTCASATCSTACKTANKCGGSASVASTIMPIRMAGSFARKTAIVGTIVHSDYCTACGMIGHRASECTTFAPNSRLEKLMNEVLEGTTLDWEVCARTH